MSTLITISVLGIICLVLEIFNLRKIVVPFSLLALAGILGLNIAELAVGHSFLTIESYGMLTESTSSKAFASLFILLAFFIVLMSPKFYADKIVKITDYVSLKIFLLAGAVAMISFGNLVMFFIGLEVLSISAYILASSKPDSLRSNEAGMKYFLMGAVASSFVLFGIALVYGTTASFDIGIVANLLLTNNVVSPTWILLGFIMLSLGMFFKMAIFPFHFWAPDVYQGSPTLTTALMSTLVKVAAIGSFFFIASAFAPLISGTMNLIIVILSILTMTVGNITALRQKNTKRMMAYSGISHAGFMLMLMTIAPAGSATVLYYAIAYSLASMAAFSVILSVCQDTEDEDISNFYGLISHKPVIAGVLALALMSLGGIPILGGFFAKFFLFREMLSVGQVTLVIAGVINSIIAIYYYFGVINVMFTREKRVAQDMQIPIEYKIVAIGCTILNIAIGLWPSLVLDL